MTIERRRQAEQRLKQPMDVGRGDQVGAAQLAPSPARDLRAEVDAFQKRLIEQALAEHAGNAAAAARALGLDRANLVRLAGRLGLQIAPRPARRGAAGR